MSSPPLSETHPSLIDCISLKQENYCGEFEQRWVREEDVQLHTRDNARIKQVIREVKKKYASAIGVVDAHMMLLEIEQELELID